MLTKTLAKHAHAIQRKFNKAVAVRKLPKIRFRYDDSGAI
jgi:ribosome-binding factor A